MGLKRKGLAPLLDTERLQNKLTILNGKERITLTLAKALHQKLNIDSDMNTFNS